MKNQIELAKAITTKAQQLGFKMNSKFRTMDLRSGHSIKNYLSDGLFSKSIVTGISGTGKNWFANQLHGIFPKTKVVDYDKYAEVTSRGWYAQNLPEGQVLIVGADSVRHGLGDNWAPKSVIEIFIMIPSFDAYRKVQALKAEQAPKDSPYVGYWTAASKYADTAVATRMFDGLRTVLKNADKDSFLTLVLTDPDSKEISKGWF